MPRIREGTPTAQTTSSGDIRVDALSFTARWSTTSLTFSFGAPGQSFYSTAPNQYDLNSGELSQPGAALSDIQMQASRQAFEAFESVSGLSFTEVVDDASTTGTIRLSFTQTPDAVQAYAYLPSNGAKAGDIWFNTNSSSFGSDWKAGSYEYLSALHEIGHSLGLVHPFEDDNVAGQPLPENLDSRQFTVMSYSALAGEPSSFFSYEPTTPMLLDILAIQRMYGKNAQHASRNNLLEGLTGNDRLTGDAGNDTLDAGGGNDIISAGSGNDLVMTGDGNDVIHGGSGADTLDGGNGADLFKFSRTTSRSDSADTTTTAVDPGTWGIDTVTLTDGDMFDFGVNEKLDGTAGATALDILVGAAGQQTEASRVLAAMQNAINES